jgi:hypothetical protein
MSRQTHYLKCETEYYQAVERGDKNFELRKNDRDYNQWDRIVLKEVVNGVETGKEMGPFEIDYILHGGRYGLQSGYCIFNIRRQFK